MSSSTQATPGRDRRDYRLGKRAQAREETRRRIVEAAVDLHCTIGPARTTISQIADRAGVQRHTYYAHFPDERGLFIACSGLAMERDPLPDAEQWRGMPSGRQRLHHGLAQIYGWYERNSGHAACVLRDAEHHALTREMVEMRIAPFFQKASEILGAGLDERSRVLLGVALDFACWRKLSETCNHAEAAALMSDAVVGSGRQS